MCYTIFNFNISYDANFSPYIIYKLNFTIGIVNRKKKDYPESHLGLGVEVYWSGGSGVALSLAVFWIFSQNLSCLFPLRPPVSLGKGMQLSAQGGGLQSSRIGLVFQSLFFWDSVCGKNIEATCLDSLLLSLTSSNQHLVCLSFYYFFSFFLFSCGLLIFLNLPQMPRQSKHWPFCRSLSEDYYFSL